MTLNQKQKIQNNNAEWSLWLTNNNCYKITPSNEFKINQNQAIYQIYALLFHLKLVIIANSSRKMTPNYRFTTTGYF